MSFFQSLFSSSSAPKESASGETRPFKMSLDERMAFRREMLFDAVTTTMESRGILSGSYRFKIMRADKRGHSFVVMVDLSADFMESEQGRQKPLTALATAIGKTALTRYGLGVAAVYWRVNEKLKGSDPWRANTAAAPDDRSPESAQFSNVQKYERATAQDLAAFEAAWQKNDELIIGDRSYASDLAPLGGSDSKDSA